MKSFIKIFGALVIIFMMGMTPLLTRAQTDVQEDLFGDSLGNIKEKLLEEDEGRGDKRIEVIDFSGKPWGNLPQEIIEKLEDSFENLETLAKEFASDELSPTEQVDELMNTHELTDRQANEVLNAIAFRGETQLNTVILTVANALKNLIGALAILLIVIAGLRLALAQGEQTAIEEQKKHIIYAVVGLGIILLVEQLVRVIYGAPGVIKTLEPRLLDLEFNEEILGVVAYVKSLLAVLGVAMIIVSGARTIFAFGEEEKIKRQRVAIVWIIAGLILVIINQTVVEQFFAFPVRESIQALQESPTLSNENVNAVIAVFSQVTKFALGFMGIIALLLFVYGGALMISNYSSDEQVEKAKKIMKNAAIGIVVTLTAFALMATLIDFTP